MQSRDASNTSENDSAIEQFRSTLREAIQEFYPFWLSGKPHCEKHHDLSDETGVDPTTLNGWLTTTRYPRKTAVKDFLKKFRENARCSVHPPDITFEEHKKRLLDQAHKLEFLLGRLPKKGESKPDTPIVVPPIEQQPTHKRTLLLALIGIACVVLIVVFAVNQFNRPQMVENPILAGVNYCDAGRTMVLIEAGDFIKGSTSEDVDLLLGQHCDPDDVNCNEDIFWDELPQTTNTLPTYCIDQHEVNNREFSRFVEETGYETTAEEAGRSLIWDEEKRTFEELVGVDWRRPNGPTTDASTLQNHPVVQVSWYDAVAYCAWLDKRLPTSDEWEKAARGTEGYLYPWGNEWDATKLNYYAEDKWHGTTPIDMYPSGVSPYGLYDTLGNAMEWVEGEMPMDATLKERRGANWASVAIYSHVAWRNYRTPESTSPTTGFRCASDVPQ